MTTKQVRYTGALHGVKCERHISKNDWALLGIKAGPNIWHEGNGYALPADDFTPEQLAVLAQDGGFVVT